MWTDWQFWKDSTWRSFRTFCQTLAALLGGQAVNVLTAEWKSMLSVSATAALVSLLMSVDRGRAYNSGAHNATAQQPAEPYPAQLTQTTAYDPAYQPAEDAVPFVGCGGDLR